MPLIPCAELKYDLCFKAHYLWNFILSYFDGQGTYIFRLIGAPARHILQTIGPLSTESRCHSVV